MCNGHFINNKEPTLKKIKKKKKTVLTAALRKKSGPVLKWSMFKVKEFV